MQQEPLDQDEKIIICGLGNVGIKTYHLFLKLGYSDIAVINLQTLPEWKILLEQHGTPLFEDDIRHSATLVKAGVKSATILVATTNSDQANLSCALDAQKLNPNIKAVIRVHSEELCDSLKTSLNLAGAFNPKAVAAPLFSVQSIGEHILGYYIDPETNQDFVFLDSRKCIHSHQDLIQMGGLPVFEIQGNALAPFDRKQDPEDSKPYIFFTPVSQRLKAIEPSKPKVTALDKSLVSLTKTILNPDFQIKFLFGLLILLISTSILVFHWALGMEFVDSIYFAITIVSTVGFGDYDLKEAPFWIKMYGCLLMLSGPALIATAFSLITNFILSNRLQPTLGLKKLPKQNHVIVIGDASLSHRIAKNLTAIGYKTVLVSNENLANSLGSKNIYFYESSRKTTDYLHSLHINNAHALIACSSNDLENINIGLQAKRISKSLRIILRTFDTKLAERLRESLDIEEVVCSAQIAADHCVANALYPSNTSGISFGAHFLEIKSKPKVETFSKISAKVDFDHHCLEITAHSLTNQI